MNVAKLGGAAAATALGLFMGTAGCGGHESSSMSVSGPSVSGVQVSVGGNATTELLAGETRQLAAAAVNSDGSRIDVTNVAEWKSSNSATATVSTAGVVTAVTEGAVDVTATHKGASGTIRLDVRRCALALTPPTVAIDAFGGSRTLQVATSPGGCRWTARSEAPWLGVPADAPREGSGSLSYTVAANSAPDARSGNLVITTADGTAATHAVSQGRPASCSYVTRPDTLTFTAAGGTGAFDVIATPSDCRWTLSNTLSAMGVYLTGAYGGTGNGRVGYLVQAHSRPVDVDGYIEVNGLSGLNPPGRHHIIVLKR